MDELTFTIKVKNPKNQDSGRIEGKIVRMLDVLDLEVQSFLLREPMNDREYRDRTMEHLRVRDVERAARDAVV